MQFPLQTHKSFSSIKLSNIRIASPCPADWNKMSGDDRVRYCAECNLNVYNFSAMTEAEVERLLGTREGRLCARFYQRADGTILTQDCPVGWRVVVRRVSRVAGAALSAIMSVGVAAAQSSVSPMQGEIQQPVAGVVVLVLDQQGAVITNAQIVVSDEAGRAVVRGMSDHVGQLTLIGLQDRPYLLEISAPGFHTRKEKIKLTARHLTTLQVQLDVAATMGVIVEVGPAAMGAIEVTDTLLRSDIDPIPYLSVPTPQLNPFKRFLTNLFHRLAF